jgi:hypothetical protein
LIIIGVSRCRTRGGVKLRHPREPTTLHGNTRYLGNKDGTFVFGYDENGRFFKRRINPIQGPIFRARIQHIRTYQCSQCRTRFKSIGTVCPLCGHDQSD